MEKYNIAFTGVFDIENYGDHLFPLVFSEMMKEKKVDCELFLFSPIGNVEQGYGQKRPIYPLHKMQELHDLYRFDAVIVGGGGILHYSSGKQMLNDELQTVVDYRVFETWVIPSMFAYKNKVKLIWNLPGGYQDFDFFYRPLTRLLCNNVDYLNTRDLYSKKILTACGISEEKIYTCLDSGFLIRKLYTKECMKDIQKNIFTSEKYIVFHANVHLDKGELPGVVSNLYELKQKGYDIVLLPIAYTHNDQLILNKINEYSIGQYGEAGRFIMLGNSLNMLDIMSVLACCKMYIGVSFHGAVTALSFSNIAIGYDYMRNGKTKDLFETLNLSDYYITNADDMNQAIEYALKSDLDIRLDEKISDIDKHFDNICNVLHEPYKEKNSEKFYIELSQTIFELNSFYDEYQKYEGLVERYNDLDQLARATHIQYETLKNEYNELNCRYQEVSQRLEYVEKKLEKVKNTVFYKGYKKFKK